MIPFKKQKRLIRPFDLRMHDVTGNGHVSAYIRKRKEGAGA